MRRTALVTGANGFVGRYAARQLARDGLQVIGVGHGSWARNDWESWGLTAWNEADVTLESLIAYAGKPDVIIHCAGGGSVGYSMTHPHQDFQRTVATMLAVLEFSRVHAPQARIAYPSSVAVYGEVKKLPISEANIPIPVSPYGAHKFIAEQLCKSYSQQFGLHVAVVRLFSVYGVGLRKQLLWDASKKIVKNDTNFSGTGEELRDWLQVEDAARLLKIASEHSAPNCPIVNGGSGASVSVKEILTELFACFGRTDEPSFSGAIRGGDPFGHAADISLAKNWGWKPEMDRRSSLSAYVEWFRDVTS